MISKFPDNRELYNFFESEPKTLDPDSSWLYNKLEFTVMDGDHELRAVISPSCGNFHFRSLFTNELIFDIEFHPVDQCSICPEGDMRYMLLRFLPEARMKDVQLFIKSRIKVTAGNTAY